VVPAVASANEVTNWNAIALNTIAAQPPIASAAPPTMVFAAMVRSTAPSMRSTVTGGRT
jgi:hypothetical protein